MIVSELYDIIGKLDGDLEITMVNGVNVLGIFIGLDTDGDVTAMIETVEE